MFIVFIRRDLRGDMKEFIEKHDDEERRKSQRRFSHLTEDEKRKMSVHYRQSHTSPTQGNGNVNSNGTGEDVELRNVKKLDDMDESRSPEVGSPNSAYKKEEIPVFYNVQGDNVYTG